MKLLLYCTKAKPYLFKNPTNIRNRFIKDYWYANKLDEKPFDENILNGKIVAECDFEVEEIKYDWYPCDILPIGEHYYTYYHTKSISTAKEFYSKSCLDWDKLNQYLNDYDSQKFEGGYAIHIKNLHIFDEPRELSDYYKYINKPIINAPQNMMKAFGIKEYSRRYVENGYVYEVRGDDITDYVLISIQPQWLCKILNGEKTIEVRKKVLKEMLE